MNYTELDWRWAILLGVALRDGLLDAVSDRSREPAELADELGLDARAVYVVLSVLAELGILEEKGEGFGLREEHRAPLVERDGPEAKASCRPGGLMLKASCFTRFGERARLGFRQYLSYNAHG